MKIIPDVITNIIAGIILAGMGFLWKGKAWIARKFKSIYTFLHLKDVALCCVDFYQRIFQNYKKFDVKPSLLEYVESFPRWESKSDETLTLNVKMNDKISTYRGVKSVHLWRQVSGFIKILKGREVLDFVLCMTIVYEPDDYSHFTMGLFDVSDEEVYKVMRMCYYELIISTFSSK